jgi:hypothetical protein
MLNLHPKKVNMGLSKKTGISVFGHIGLDISVTNISRPDNKTDIVEPIYPFVNMDISVLDISVPIYPKPIYPYL